VPVSALDWINPKSGQILRLTQPGIWPEGSFREGTVERLTAGLSATGRMAELVVGFPLCRNHMFCVRSDVDHNCGLCGYRG